MKQRIILSGLVLLVAAVITQIFTQQANAIPFRTTTTFSTIQIQGGPTSLPFDADTVLTLTQDFDDSGVYQNSFLGASTPTLAANLNISGSPADDGDYSPLEQMAYIFADGGGARVGRMNSGDNSLVGFTIPSGELSIDLQTIGMPFTLNPNVGTPVDSDHFNLPLNLVLFRRIVLDTTGDTFDNQFSYNMDITNEVSDVPEPSACVLLLLGSTLLLGRRRRQAA